MRSAELGTSAVRLLPPDKVVKTARSSTTYVVAAALTRKSIAPYFALEALMATAHEMGVSPTDLAASGSGNVDGKSGTLK